MAKQNGRMTVEAASRIYSAEAKNGDGKVAKGEFGSRAMSAAMRPKASTVSPAGGKLGGGKKA